MSSAYFQDFSTQVASAQPAPPYLGGGGLGNGGGEGGGLGGGAYSKVVTVNNENVGCVSFNIVVSCAMRYTSYLVPEPISGSVVASTENVFLTPAVVKNTPSANNGACPSAPVAPDT